VPLPNGDIVRLGLHEAKDGKVTMKLRLPGEWSVDQLFRGANNATMSVLVATRE
jgi:hypothetical protein